MTTASGFPLRAVVAALLCGTLAPKTAAQETFGGALRAEGQKMISDSFAATKDAGSKVTGIYTVPEVPATTFLNVSAAKIARPSTPRDFALALADGVDEQGRARAGFALEGSPASIFPGVRVTLKEYQSDYLKFVLANLLISLGTSRASGDTSSTDVAYGLRTTLLDRGDPMRDTAFTRQLGAAFLGCRPKGPPRNVPRPGTDTVTDALKAELESRRAAALECMSAAGTKLAEEYARANWNAARISLAYAGGFRLLGSELSNGRHLGDRIWATAAVPLGTVAQGMAYFDFSHMRTLAEVPAFSTFSYGARLNLGAAKYNGFFELVGEARTDPPPGIRSTRSVWSLGFEFLATEGVWLSTGFGKRAAEALQPDRVAVIANIRWGFSSKPWLRP